MYDYLVVGSGLFGATFAFMAKQKGKKCLVLEKRPHIGGNIYTKKMQGIQVHQYGAHIFHTNMQDVWDFVCRFASFNRYTNSPVANFNGQIYNLPFNMNTFNRMWGAVSPQEAMDIIAKQQNNCFFKEPKNLEEQALNLVGRDIYEKLIKGYTEKQWGRPCKQLPASIIKRLPVRFTYDNNYFDDLYQGIPIGGYTKMIEAMLLGIECKLKTNYLDNSQHYSKMAKTIVYTGPIDEFYGYCLGPLEYRHVHFKTKVMDTQNYQGNAVVNYTDTKTPYTRIIEHKHFEFGQQPKTVISFEYSSEWQKGMEPYYPISNQKNTELYEKYCKLAQKDASVIFGGRLGTYKYYNMDQVVANALCCAKDFI